MRVHHLNCGTMHPPGGPLVRTGAPGDDGSVVCHCMLVETHEGLVLIDSGFGVADARDPHGRIGRFALTLIGARPAEPETAVRQIEAMGHRASDVRHVVLTHLDLDHAGGLSDFPEATVHVMQAELEATRSKSRHALRYRPVQWAHGPRWATYADAAGERWFGFDAVRSLRGLPDSILLVPLHGHSAGHACVAVDTGSGWLLACGDLYMRHGQVDASAPRCPRVIELFQRINDLDAALRRQNTRRVAELVSTHGAEVMTCCAHDAWEWRQAKMRGRQPDM